MAAALQPPSLVSMGLYDTTNGTFLGLTTQLAYIILRGDSEEAFFSYGYNRKIYFVVFVL